MSSHDAAFFWIAPLAATLAAACSAPRPAVLDVTSPSDVAVTQAEFKLIDMDEQRATFAWRAMITAAEREGPRQNIFDLENPPATRCIGASVVLLDRDGFELSSGWEPFQLEPGETMNMEGHVEARATMASAVRRATLVVTSQSMSRPYGVWTCF